jgi:hypothetical protein
VGQSLLADPGGGKERRRLGGRPLRSQGSRRQEVELGTTSAKGQFEVVFRFYGPGKPLFEKTWKLPDIERARWRARPTTRWQR